jgi:hypothetical protein
MDENEKKEEWCLNVKEHDIQDATVINMDEIEDEIDVEEIVKQ